MNQPLIYNNPASKINNRWIFLIITIFALPILVFGIARVPILDRDEPHFAQATRQMLQTQNYFHIRFQNTTRFQKPPGINWLQAISVHLLSHPDSNLIWPYRVPSVIGGLLSLWLTYFFFCRYIAPHILLFALALLGSSLLFVIESHLAVTDSVLLSTIILMQGSLFCIYMQNKADISVSKYLIFLFWAGSTLGFLIKGVTPLVGLLTIGALYWMDQDKSWLKSISPLTGITCFISLSFGWLFFVNQAENTNYLLAMFHKDLLPKLTGGHEGHGRPPLFHLLSLPVLFWPSSFFLLYGYHYARDHFSDPIIRFLIAWIIPTWIFFEIMPTKLPQYVLPTFPAIAILCGLGFFTYKDGATKKSYSIVTYGWLILSSILCSGLGIISYWFVENERWIIGLYLFYTITLCYLWRFFWSKHKFRAMGWCIWLLIFGAYPLTFCLLASLAPFQFPNQLAHLIPSSQISTSEPLLAVGYNEPSLVFNLNTHLVKFISLDEASNIIADYEPPIMLFNREEWDKMALVTKNKLKIDAQLSGFNYNSGKWTTLYITRTKHT